MSENSKGQSPPYAAFPSFISFLNKLRDTQVPSRIDPTVFGNASGSISYSTIAALKYLKLIGADGVPNGDFINFVMADDNARKPMMQAILKAAYPTLWTNGFSLATTTAGQFDEHIRSEYDVKGSTVDKVATFFIAAAKFADLQISPHLAARKPTASSASSAKSKRQRKVQEEEVKDGGGHTPAGTGTDTAPKALQYQLIDLMGEAGITDPEREAIWTLVRFLTSKKQTG